MDPAIPLSLSESSAEEARVPAVEQIFPDLDLLLSLDGDPPGPRVLAFRRLGEVSARRGLAREERGAS